MESCWSDLPPRELLLGFGVVEYFGGYLMKSRSSSFLIHLRSFVMAVMAHALVTRGLKQVYSSNLLVTYGAEGDNAFQWGGITVELRDSRDGTGSHAGVTPVGQMTINCSVNTDCGSQSNAEMATILLQWSNWC